jgi:hypothetical protein
MTLWIIAAFLATRPVQAFAELVRDQIALTQLQRESDLRQAKTAALRARWVELQQKARETDARGAEIKRLTEAHKEAERRRPKDD